MKNHLKKHLPRFRSPEARNLMCLALSLDPGLAPDLRHFIRMGVRDIRPDYMLVKNHETDKYDYMDDPGAWNATLDLPSGSIMLVCLLRGRDGKWFITGS